MLFWAIVLVSLFLIIFLMKKKAENMRSIYTSGGSQRHFSEFGQTVQGS